MSASRLLDLFFVRVRFHPHRVRRDRVCPDHPEFPRKPRTHDETPLRGLSGHHPPAVTEQTRRVPGTGRRLGISRVVKIANLGYTTRTQPCGRVKIDTTLLSSVSRTVLVGVRWGVSPNR